MLKPKKKTEYTCKGAMKVSQFSHVEIMCESLRRTTLDHMDDYDKYVQDESSDEEESESEVEESSDEESNEDWSDGIYDESD